MNYTTIKNNQTIPITEIPELEYRNFLELNTGFLNNSPERHCVNYFGYPIENKIKLICCIADDNIHQIHVSSCLVKSSDTLDSFSALNFNFEKFEREIHENFGIGYKDHPWLKPVRYAHNRADKTKTIANYPFFAIDSDELHEVGVGPIHAGVIEPGHFRFWDFSTGALNNSFWKRKNCFSEPPSPNQLPATLLLGIPLHFRRFGKVYAASKFRVTLNLRAPSHSNLNGWPFIPAI